jgi:hypothetical protein
MRQVDQAKEIIMLRSKQAVPLLITALLLVLVAVVPVLAGGEPLPAMPSQSVIDEVIRESGGVVFTPLYAPNLIRQQLVAFSGEFDNVENTVNFSQAVNYFTTSGRLTETVIPLVDSRTAILDPVFTAPGREPRPAKIIGALYQPARGTMVVVAVFKPEAWQCPGCNPPEKVRFYYDSTQYYEYSLYWGQFADYGGDGKLEAVDDGALIAHKYTCVAVGLEQVCWDPYSYSALRDEPTPKDLAYAAYTRAKDRYNLGVDFYVDDAVPDLVGAASRAACAIQLQAATQFNSLSQCVPNVVFTASKSVMNGQPVGIWVAQRNIAMWAYTAAGVFTGNLPAGEYLVMPARPSLTVPGTPDVLFLIDINGVNHYLIPSVVMQGFGQNPVVDERHAAIKDGTMSSRGF